MKRQCLARLERMRASKVPNIEEVAPALGVDLIDGAPDVPWQSREPLRIELLADRGNWTQLLLHQTVEVFEDLASLLKRTP